jgi:hypothetical protein
MATQIGDVLNSLSDPAQNPAVQTENQTILDFHSLLENTGDQADLVGAIHGLTNTGETVGLGKVGDDNLITDTAQAPGDLLNGANPVSEAANTVTDTGQIVSAAGALIQGAGSDLSNPDVVQDAATGLSGATLGGGDGPLISASAGPSGESPILDAGVLTPAANDAPVGAAIGNGPSLVNAQLLDNNDPLNLNGADGSGDHLVTGSAGAPGGTPVGDAGVLTSPDSDAPLGVNLASAPNIANASVLGSSPLLQDATGVSQGITGADPNGEHLATANAGAVGGAPLAEAGVLTTPDAQTPVGAEVANAQNLAAATLLPHSDVLSFPNLGGAGTDALTGVAPSAIDLGSAMDGGSTTAPAAADHPLIDLHTDNGPLLQTHDNPTSTLAINNHAIV